MLSARALFVSLVVAGAVALLTWAVLFAAAPPSWERVHLSAVAWLVGCVAFVVALPAEALYLRRAGG